MATALRTVAILGELKCTENATQRCNRLRPMKVAGLIGQWVIFIAVAVVLQAIASVVIESA